MYSKNEIYCVPFSLRMRLEIFAGPQENKEDVSVIIFERVLSRQRTRRNFSINWAGMQRAESCFIIFIDVI